LKFDKSTTKDDTLFRAVSDTFNILAYVKNFGIADVDSNRKVSLDISGSGMQFYNDQMTKSFNLEDTVAWSVISPADAGSGMIHVYVDDPPLDVNSGYNGFVRESNAADSINIAFIPVHDILLTAHFEKGGQSLDSLTVSTHQDSIHITARIIFESLLDTDRKVTLNLPEGYGTLDTMLTKELTEQITDVDWWVIAPKDERAWKDITVKASAKSSYIPWMPEKVSAEVLAIKTEQRAVLTLDMAVVEPQGAQNDTVSYEQAFKIKALVSNIPQGANTLNNGKMSIHLPSIFSLVDSSGVSSDIQKSFVVDEPIYWWIRISPEALKNLISPKDQKVGPFTVHTPYINIARMINAENREIIVRMDTIPTDVNTLRPAAVQNIETEKTIHIQSVAKAEIASIESPNDVSTSQVIELKVTAILNENLIEPIAHIILPSSFGYTLEPLPLDDENSAKWSIRIPDQYPVPHDSIQLYLGGKDKNTGKPVANSAVRIHQLNFYQSPVLAVNHQILSPNSAIEEGQLSYGQEIEVAVNTAFSPLNGALSYAPLQGGGTIRLDSSIITEQGFTLADGETIVKPFAAVGDQIIWRLIAPKSEKTVSIKFSYDELPHDRNSGIPAALDAEHSTVALPISIRSKKINVSMLDSLIADKTFQQGDKKMLLMAFRVSNKRYRDELFVRGLRLDFYKAGGDIKNGELIDRQLLQALFKSIKVVNYRAYNDDQLAKNASSGEELVFAEYILDDNTDNPLQLDFDRVDSLRAEEEDSLFVIAEVRDDAPNKSFIAVLKDVQLYDVDPSILLSAVDDENQELANSDKFITHTFTVIDQDPEAVFRNYPNPFGAQYDHTTIAFKLEHPSDVTIRIYTLVGELVWTKSITGLSAQIYDDLVTWDGKNDRGNTVLNGVYLCTIEIKPTDGGKAARYITKIAYIK
jgi:hypothetical protein